MLRVCVLGVGVFGGRGGGLGPRVVEYLNLPEPTC